MRKIIVISPPIIASRLYSTTIPQTIAHWALKKHLLYDVSTNKDKEKANKSQVQSNICTRSKSLSLLDELGLVGVVNAAHNERVEKRYGIEIF